MEKAWRTTRDATMAKRRRSKEGDFRVGLWSRARVHASRERPRALALGIWLASRGGLVLVSLVLTALGALGSSAYVLAAPDRALAHLPTTAAFAMAWSTGITLAFAGALRAISRDWEEGVIALLRARGVRAQTYARDRAVGLVIVLASALGGATLVVGLAATCATSDPADTARVSLGAIVYALGFAATLGPVALATLGGESRTRGYLLLIAVLVVPELVAPWTVALLPRGWHELTSIPAALAAVMAGVDSPSTSSRSMVRAALGLSAVIAVSLAAIRARVPRVSRTPRGDCT